MLNANGYRGYIGSRSYQGQRTPQHVQNLVIRDYCQRNNFTYLLSATEYHMPGCFIMLNEIMAELPKIEGIVLFSIFMLPNNRNKRHGFVHRILDAGATLHGALENLAITNEVGFLGMEEIFAVNRIATQGRIEI